MVSRRFRFRWVPGIALNFLLASIGALLVVNHDVRTKKDWVGAQPSDTCIYLVSLQEPLVEKARSYKAEATVNAVKTGEHWQPATGRILLYFQKDSLKPVLHYGDQIILRKPLQPIKNSGNPGAFDYAQFCAFKDIYHQVFLRAKEWHFTGRNTGSALQKWLLEVRGYVIETMRRYIKSEREVAVAEALLIGYRDDLDKDLVQAYSNTGVVHIIAISGLHLGMIYAGLVFLLRPFKNKRYIRWLRPVCVLLVLWLFTLLAGGAPSIVRSAVMFTFIVVGESIQRKTSIYNTMAASAFVMLLVNPYYLWDIGFQLSFTAVLSIVAFSRPIYNLLYFRYKIPDYIWKMSSVTLSAQILTLPVIFYSFHQFPNFFLFTNLVIVPLSSLVLFLEIAVLALSFVPDLAQVVGIITGFLLRCMNGFVEQVDRLPYALSDNIQNSLTQTILLYLIIIAAAYWLMEKHKAGLFLALAGLLMFMWAAAIDTFRARKQALLIVYHVPKHRAADFIVGKQYLFVGDSALRDDAYLRNFHLKPARTLFRVQHSSALPQLKQQPPVYHFAGKRLLFIDRQYRFDPKATRAADVIIVSGNPRLNLADMADAFKGAKIVFDGSNSQRRIQFWQRECDSLGLQHHATYQQGPYILTIR